MNRQEIIERYRQTPEVDVLIVGGGINGIGTFRDLALQGVSVLLVDKGDFCSGASAASSRLAHGGIRYLENGEFRLVRESLTERNRLLRNAPHAVHPLLFTIPVYHWFSGILNAPLKFMGLLKKPSERGVIVVKLGMTMYDWLTRNNRMTGTHALLPRAQALAKHKYLNPDILYVATYYDSIMPQAERIGLELVLDAEADDPQARALNDVALVGGDGETVQLRDEVSGAVFEVKPKLMINASGGWIDFVNRAVRHETHFIGGTKGSHIVVDHPELLATLNGSAVYFENKDGRMCIFAPFGDKVIIGATDIRIDDPDQAVCTDEEIDYFFGFTSFVFPGLRVQRSDIVYTFSGVRPLPATDVEFAGLISRDHRLPIIQPDDRARFPIYSLVGGKWTTYRAFSEQATDRALAFLGKMRRAGTETLAIGGGKDYPATPAAREPWLARVQSETGLPRPRVEQLFERYGTTAQTVAAFIAAETDAPLRGQPAYSAREILYIATYEKVTRLEDVILRRTLLGMLGLINGESLEHAAQIVGGALGWSSDRTHEEIERTKRLLIDWHGVPAERLSNVDHLIR